MKKLIEGIAEFHRTRREDVKKTFAHLALGQSPDVLFIGCSDSRVAVNVFASTEPGDLFVVRNVGNLVTPSHSYDDVRADESEVAAMEFALDQLQVRHVIVCGHSDCGAMKALCAGIEKLDLHFLKSWLRHGEEALVRVRAKKQDLSFNEEVKAVSQANVLLQLEHLKTYGRVAESVRNGKLMLHGLWFDIQNTDVYYANLEDGAFRVIDDIEGDKILRRLGLS